MPNLIEQDMTPLQRLFLRIGVIKASRDELELKRQQYEEIQNALCEVWEINVHRDYENDMYGVLFTNLEEMNNYISYDSNQSEAFADVLNHIWPLLKSTQQLAILKVLQNGEI